METNTNATPSPAQSSEVKTEATAQSAADAKLANLQNTIDINRKNLRTLWSGKAANDKTIIDLFQSKWDGYSVAVRNEVLKRSQAAVIARIQTTVPRKQWAQWEVTLRFCLDEIFTRARSTATKKFAEEQGIRDLLITVVEGREHDLDKETFEGKIKEMLEEMKSNNVAGFDANDSSHGPTLRAIRSIYASDWASYLISKVATPE